MITRFLIPFGWGLFKWIAKKTKTKADDKIVKFIKFIPNAIFFSRKGK